MAFVATRPNLTIDQAMLKDLVIRMAENTAVDRILFKVPFQTNGAPIYNLLANDKITSLDGGCVAGTAKDPVKESSKTVSFSTMTVLATLCLKDLTTKLISKGFSPDADPAELAEVISTLLTDGANSDLMRLAWLGDTAMVAATLKGGATDLPNYNLKTGFYKQMNAAVSGSTMASVALDKTSGATLLNSLNLARAAEHPAAAMDSKFYLTSELYYMLELYTQSTNNPIGQQRLVDGVPTLFINGKEVVNLDYISRSIKSDFTTSFNFGILTPRENLQVHLDRAEIELSRMDRDAATGKWYLEANYQVDPKIAVDALAVAIV